MEPSCIEEMILMFEVNNADLVECAYYNYTKNRKKLHLFFGENVIFDRKKFINNVIKNTILDGKEAVVLWNKMYNRKIFERTIENYGSNLLEDYIINIQYYSAVNRYCYISKPLVNYRMVSGSLSRRYQSEVITKLNSEIIPLKKKYMEIYGFVHTEDIEANSNWYSNYVFNYLLMGTMLKNSLKTTKRAIQLIDLDELKASEKINKFSKIALKYSENIVSIYICFCGLFYRLKCKLYVLIRNKK